MVFRASLSTRAVLGEECPSPASFHPQRRSLHLASTLLSRKRKSVAAAEKCGKTIQSVPDSEAGWLVTPLGGIVPFVMISWSFLGRLPVKASTPLPTVLIAAKTKSLRTENTRSYSCGRSGCLERLLCQSNCLSCTENSDSGPRYSTCELPRSVHDSTVSTVMIRFMISSKSRHVNSTFISGQQIVGIVWVPFLTVSFSRADGHVSKLGTTRSELSGAFVSEQIK